MPHVESLGYYRNDSSVAHTLAVDLDADGQVDLLTLSAGRGEEGEEEEGCHVMAVHWMRPQREGPVIGEFTISSYCILFYHIIDKYQVIADHVLSPPLILE